MPSPLPPLPQFFGWCPLNPCKQYNLPHTSGMWATTRENNLIYLIGCQAPRQPCSLECDQFLRSDDSVANPSLSERNHQSSLGGLQTWKKGIKVKHKMNDLAVLGQILPY